VQPLTLSTLHYAPIRFLVTGMAAVLARCEDGHGTRG
jgi:hypothetical protein